MTQLLNNNSKLDLGPAWIHKEDLISKFFTESYLQKNFLQIELHSWVLEAVAGTYLFFGGVTIQPRIAEVPFPDNSVGEESACNAGDPGSISGLEDPLEKG